MCRRLDVARRPVVGGAARCDGSSLRQLLRKRFGERTLHVAGVFRRNGFDQNNPAFFSRNRIVAYAARHHVHRSFFQIDYAVAFIFNSQIAAHDVKQFVFTFMAVPDKLAENLRDLHVLIVHLRDNFG